MINSSNQGAFLRNYTLKVEAGVKQQIGLRGSVLRVVSSPVPVFFESKENGSAFYLEAGEEIVFTDRVFFNLDVFHNDAAEKTIVLAIGENAKIGSAKVSGVISGVVDLSASSLAALESINVQNTVNMVNAGQTYGASFRTNTALAANTPETIFTPAANANGAIIHSAQMAAYGAAALTNSALLAKASAPASVLDGDAILTTDIYAFTGTNNGVSASLKNPLKIPAGKGLYRISNGAETAGSAGVLYTLL